MPIQIGGFDWGQYGQQANQAAQLDLAKRAQAFSQYMQQANLDMERQRLNQALQQKMASQQYPVTGAGRSLPVGFDNMLMGNAAASRVPLPDEQEMRIAMPAQNIGMAEIRPTISPDTKKAWLKRQEMDYEDKLAEPQRQQKAKQWAEEIGLKERQTEINEGQLNRQIQKDQTAAETEKEKRKVWRDVQLEKLKLAEKGLAIKEKRFSDLNRQFAEHAKQTREIAEQKLKLTLDQMEDTKAYRTAYLEWQKTNAEIESMDKAFGRAVNLMVAGTYAGPSWARVQSDQTGRAVDAAVRLATSRIQSGGLKDEAEIQKVFQESVKQVADTMGNPGMQSTIEAPPTPQPPQTGFPSMTQPVEPGPSAFQSVMGSRSLGQTPQTPQAPMELTGTIEPPAQEDISIGQRGSIAPTAEQETDFNDEMLLQRFVSMPKTERKAAYNKLTAAQKIRVNRALGG